MNIKKILFPNQIEEQPRPRQPMLVQEPEPTEVDTVVELLKELRSMRNEINELKEEKDESITYTLSPEEATLTDDTFTIEIPKEEPKKEITEEPKPLPLPQIKPQFKTEAPTHDLEKYWFDRTDVLLGTREGRSIYQEDINYQSLENATIMEMVYGLRTAKDNMDLMGIGLMADDLTRKMEHFLSYFTNAMEQRTKNTIIFEEQITELTEELNEAKKLNEELNEEIEDIKRRNIHRRLEEMDFTDKPIEQMEISEDEKRDAERLIEYIKEKWVKDPSKKGSRSSAVATVRTFCKINHKSEKSKILQKVVLDHFAKEIETRRIYDQENKHKKKKKKEIQEEPTPIEEIPDDVQDDN